MGNTELENTVNREGDGSTANTSGAEGTHGTWVRTRRHGEVYAATTRMIALAQAIHDARTARGWSQRQLAGESGVRQATISNIEGADHTPTLETLDRLAAALDLDVNVTLTARPLADA